MEAKKKKILFIDDWHIRLAAEYLRLEGFECETVSYQNAFAEIQQDSYDGFIIEFFFDYQEPKIIQAILTINPKAFIVAYSTLMFTTDKGNYGDYIKGGVIKKWFSKPVNPQEIADFLKASLQ